MNFDSLVTTFDNIKQEWDVDSRVDFEFKNKEYSADLAQISLEIPYQHHKYLKYYNDVATLKIGLEVELRKTIKRKREYYSGEADARTYAEKPFGASIKTSEKMKIYLEADDDIIALEVKVRYADEMLKYLDQVTRMIAQRNYHVKNAIEWEKFINGEK